MDNICVSSQFLNEVFRSCQDMGARKPVLLSALKMTDAHLRGPQSRFSAKKVTALCQATAQELERENIHLNIGRGITPTGFSGIGYAAMFEDTIGGVLQAAVAAMNSGFSKPLFRWEESTTGYSLSVDPDIKVPNDLIFIIFANLFHFGSIVTNGQASGQANGHSQPIKTAHFKFRQSRDCVMECANDRSDILMMSGNGPGNGPGNAEVPCLFDQAETGLDLHRNIMNLPNPFANPEVVRAAKSQSRRYMVEDDGPGSLTRLSYHYLFHLLDRSGLSIDAAAETFGMAERTLRRKLAAEGASFRQILEQVRRDTCQLYFLEGTRSLSEIATRLGYSELSAFTRAYTAWHGRSPSRGMAAEIAVAA